MFKKISPNSKGFGLAAVLMVVIVLAVVCGTGSYVYHRSHKKKSVVASSANGSSTSQNTTPLPVDPYIGWKSGALGSTGLVFKYPGTWTLTDTTACDGAHIFTVDAPTSEVQQSALPGVGRYGFTIITDAKTSGTTKCAPSASSLEGVALSDQSRTVRIGRGILKGKYIITDGSTYGISGTYVLNNAYNAGQKLTETGVINVGRTNVLITSGLSAGQNPVGASVNGFMNSLLYEDTINMVGSLVAG